MVFTLFICGFPRKNIVVFSYVDLLLLWLVGFVESAYYVVEPISAQKEGKGYVVLVGFYQQRLTIECFCIVRPFTHQPTNKYNDAINKIGTGLLHTSRVKVPSHGLQNTSKPN